jgi:LPPG:FO 2-phospho-L-lactate transferase
VWFNLGDEDLEICRDRARRLAAGERLTDALDALRRTLGVEARVLPMCDEPVRTRVKLGGRWLPFQEFMITESGKSGGVVIEGVELDGISDARPTPEVLAAIAEADAIVIGPSNPVISIGPILEIRGLRAGLERSRAPIVAVSPLVRGAVVKGPTEPFMTWAGEPLTSSGIADHYEGVIDGLVADQRTASVPVLETDVMMDGAEGRARLARETLGFALGLS